MRVYSMMSDELNSLMLDYMKCKRIIFKKIKKYPTGMKPQTLLVSGDNMDHEKALTLTDLPLALFDKHTDMYESARTNQENRVGVRKPVSASNWVHWRLKNGGTVHFILPYDHILSLSGLIPKGAEDRFFIYADRVSEQRFTMTDENGYEVGDPIKRPILPLDNLAKSVIGPAQISIDFDFFFPPPEKNIHGHNSIEDLIKLLEKLKRKGNTYDFWLDREYEGTVDREVCPISGQAKEIDIAEKDALRRCARLVDFLSQ